MTMVRRQQRCEPGYHLRSSNLPGYIRDSQVPYAKYLRQTHPCQVLVLILISISSTYRDKALLTKVGSTAPSKHPFNTGSLLTSLYACLCDFNIALKAQCIHALASGLPEASLGQSRPVVK
jgi:hypothetical protein